MTKLLEWLFAITMFISTWGALVCRQIQSQIIEKWMFLIIPLPIILIVLLGLYAVTVVLWRVYTFNVCELAAKELQTEILRAKKELRQRGIQFNNDNIL